MANLMGVQTMIPRHCRYWQVEQPTGDIFQKHENFAVLETYKEDSHLIRQLLRCKECDQLYFYEMYEQIDWANGEDPIYRTLIPVATAEDARILARWSITEIHTATPRLLSDWPAELTQPKVYWVGKE